MAVTTTYSSNYGSDNLPTGGRPFNPPIGAGMDYVSYTIPNAQLDDAGDVSYLTAIPVARTIHLIVFDSAALDGGTALDADLVLRTTDKDGNHTDTIIYNAGTAFEAALVAKVILTSTKVPASATGYGHLLFKVNTAATTPATGAITLAIFWR